MTLMLSGAGCAGPGSPSPWPCTGQQITRSELLNADAGSTALEAIGQLRPSFLKSPTGAPPIVVVDNLPPGDLSELGWIRVGDILSVLRIFGPDATTRYGTGAMGGALIVITRGGPAADQVTGGCSFDRTVAG